MKVDGKGKLCLFNVQSEIDRDLSQLSAERIMEKLGMAKPEKKKLQKFDMPLIPKQEDFFMFPFRHLSATVVGGGTYKATDFSKQGVLKKATSYLEGKPAYLNHNQLVGKEVGTVGECEYVGPYKHANGIIVPGGIEAPFVIDSILNPELVRQLSSPVSPINSCSVTVIFDWEASHDFENASDFYWHLGEMIDDGDGTPKMVRRIVNEVSSFEESSLVWMGADPYAKMLDDDGELINIDKAAAFAMNKFSNDPDNRKWDSGRKYFVFDCLDNQKLLHLSKSFKEPKTENINPMEKDLLDFLASFFKTTPDKIKNGEFKKADAEKFEIVLKDEFTGMKTKADSVESLSKDKTTAETKVTELNGTIATLTADKTKLEGEKGELKKSADSFAVILTEAKKEAKRVYGLFAKGKPEKTIEDEIESEVSLEKLDAKIKMFGGQSVHEYGGKCAKCGGTEINFRSSKQGEQGEETGETTVNLAETVWKR